MDSPSLTAITASLIVIRYSLWSLRIFCRTSSALASDGYTIATRSDIEHSRDSSAWMPLSRALDAHARQSISTELKLPLRLIRFAGSQFWDAFSGTSVGTLSGRQGLYWV